MIPSRKWLIPLGGAALIGLLVILGSGRRTQPQYFTAKVERGDLRDAVEATGMVNAVVTVQVGSQVSGTILMSPFLTAWSAGSASLAASTYHWSVSHGSITTPERSP